LSQEPANRLIRQTARQQWRLIALNLGSTLVEAFTEGATLGVVFLAVQVITHVREKLQAGLKGKS
jgi:ATP-binding cassette subfamily B protein/subfamily B ATP-binding cassette protein MsbA